MSDPVPPDFDEEAMKHLRSLPAFRIDPGLREWRAPNGVLASPAGLAASFRALRMRSVVDTADGTVRFEAWKTPRWSGAVLASLLGASVYVGLASAGVRTVVIGVVVVVTAFYVPIALLPSYRVAGRIEGGTVLLRLHVRGLFGRPRAFEQRLRFYLER